jgi:lathosterol oxidase
MDAFVVTFFKVSGINLLRYFIIAGIPFVLYYVLFSDKFRRFKIQTKNASSSDFYREILHSVQTTFVFGLIALVLTYSPLAKHTLIYKDFSAFPTWWMPISLFLAMLFHDTYFYWMHRLMHTRFAYKYVHLVHHKSTNPSPWASYSFHFLEAVVEGIVILPIVLIIPVHPITIVVFISFGFLMNVYGHLGFEILPKWYRRSVLFKLLNTSVYHNMHHSQVNGNYSLYFRHWDILMKTENKNYEPYFEKVIEQREKVETAIEIKAA